MDVKLIECSTIDVPKVGNDLRTFSKEFAIKLADSIKCEGMYVPIVVRPNPASSGRFILVQGKHRLYAKKNVLKEQFIEAFAFEDMDDTDAEMAMISENLWRNPLAKTQLSLSLKKWWEHFVAKNPERAVLGSAGRAAAAKTRKAKKAAEAATTNGGDEAGQAQADVKSDEADQGQAASESSFAEQVSATTGQSAASVKRSLRIAKAFDADQLEAFAQMETSQADMTMVAKIKDKTKRDEVVNLIASGMVPEDAVKEVMKDAAPIRDVKGKSEAEAKAKAKEEKAPEMSDDEWFTTYCGEKAAMLGDPARFKADALLYRKVTDQRHTFRCKVKSAVKATAEAGTKGSFWNLVNRLISISHPKHWLLCDQCKGKGKVLALGDKCSKCFGGGYLMKTEEYL